MSLDGKATAKNTIKGNVSLLKTIHGYSAYEIAVINGFKGTEDEWLNSLKGAKGDKGERGDKGDTGAQGVKGDKGDDYVLTPDDIETISNLARPTIDQTYSPDSENAQSGKAVAEAFENQKVVLLDHTLTEEQAGAQHLSFALNAEQVEFLIKAKTLNMHLSFPCENETVSGNMCVRMYVGYSGAYAYYFCQSYFAYAEGKTVDCVGTTHFYDFDRLQDGDRSYQTLISNGNPYYGNCLNNYGNASSMMGYIRPSYMHTLLPSIQISNNKIPFKAGTKIYWEVRL